jgi:hypothetical protein
VHLAVGSLGAATPGWVSAVVGQLNRPDAAAGEPADFAEVALELLRVLETEQNASPALLRSEPQIIGIFDR